MRKNPKVSVIMPSYNKQDYIEEAITSILQQTMQDFELILIDDASTDETVAVIQQILRTHEAAKKIRFYQNEQNEGIAATRNRALQLARGTYLALLDADDKSPCYRLENQVNYLEQHADVAVVYGGCQEIDEHGNEGALYISSFQNPAYIRANLLIRDIIPNGSGMYRKSFINEHQIRYRDGYFGMDDYLFWVECSLKGKIVGLPETLLYWRNQSENTTNQVKKNPKDARNRAEKYKEIQKRALLGNGFSLTETEMNLYHTVFAEDGYGIKEREELEQFHQIICKLIRQAEKKEHASTWQLMFKRQFGRSMERSYVWDGKY